MSLQVWLPLNGTLENLGLDDITFTQTTVAGYEVGKIGQALSLLGTNIAFTAPSLEGLTKFSVAFWFKSKTNSSITTNWNNVIAINSSNADESTTTEWRFESSYAKSTSYILSAHNNTGDPIMTGTGSLVSERDKWYHVVATCDGESFIKFYINGEHINSDKPYLGGHLRSLVKIANESADPDALLNDLRIYDHALSQKEVKLLSQGLVAHYPLNDGIGGANIAWNSSLTTDLTSWNKSGTWNFVEKEGFRCCHNTGAFQTTATLSPKQTFNTTTDGMLPYNGLIITMSADVLLENVVKGTTNYYLALYQSGETINGSWRSPAVIANSGHFISAASNLLDPNKLNGKGWTHVWVTYKWGDYAWSNTNYRLQFYARDYTGDVYVKNLKIELGEKPTPWIPNPADALYSKMGLDNGIVYDCSGYGHYGNIVNTTSITSDTPRYKATTYFNSGAYVRIDNIQSGNLENSYTMAYWAKIANGKIPCGYRDGNRLNIYITSDLICCNTGDGNQNPFQLNGASVNVEQYYNEWHHYAMSGDGSESKLYIDGEYKGSAKTYRPMTGTHFVINGWDFNTSYKINYISDVRIYATALSPEDIKSLYETRASIDNYSNTYAYEFMEV